MTGEQVKMEEYSSMSEAMSSNGDPSEQERSRFMYPRLADLHAVALLRTSRIAWCVGQRASRSSSAATLLLCAQ